MRPTWLAYFWTGSIALILSWALSAVLTGCRVGNRIQNGENPDQISGYYQTQAQTLSICVSRPSAHCATASPSQVPSLISAEMVNPVALIVQDLSSGFAYLTPPGGRGPAIPVYVNADSSLSYLGDSAAQVVWKDPACTAKTYLELAGMIHKGTGGQVTVNGNTLTAAGRIELHAQVTQSFVGNCAHTLQDMSACIQDSSQCQGTGPADNQQMQAQIQAIFNPYIQSGAMAATDIPSVTNLSYEAQYE